MERRRRVVDGLVGAGLLVLVLVLAGCAAFLALSRPAGAGPTGGPAGSGSPATSAPPPGAEPPGVEPPGDLTAEESWVGGLQGDVGTVVQKGQRLDDVTVGVAGLRTSADGSRTATNVRVSATVPFASLAAQVGPGARVGYVDAGHIRVQRPYELLGRAVDVDAVASVSADGTEVVVTPTEVSLGGSGVGGRALAGAASALVSTRKPIPNLPEGLLLTGTTVTERGLVVRLEGQDVRLDP